jgi:hypothetical protein
MKSALIAAVVAAVVAATSSTAATIVVTSKNIKNGTIQTVDMSGNAKRALRGQRGPRGFSGPPGATGATGAQGIQRLRFVIGPEVSIPPGGLSRSDALCPAGETAVTGGFSLISGSGAAHLFQEIGVGTAWVAQAANPFGASDTARLQAYAYCSPNVSPTLAYAGSEVAKARGGAEAGLALLSHVSHRAPLGLATPSSASATSATPGKYANCKALNRKYPHGIGRVGARDKTSGVPVTNFKRSNRLYRLNKARDRDKDGIACEKR